jgi:uncharacterized protein
MPRLFHPCPFFILSLFIAVPVFPAIPAPGARVSDYAGILSQADRERLQGVIGRVEASTTAEVFVVTVPSLDGLTVEEYANRLFNQWGIGKKGKDNGLLVLVAPKDRKMRIETGYGMEAVVPDGLAGAVIRESFIPHFKKDDYAGGILAGVDRLAAIVEGRESAAVPASEPDGPFPARHKFAFVAELATCLFISIFTSLGMGALGYAFSSKTGFFILWGGMFAGIPMIMLLASPELGPFRLIPAFLGLVALFLGYRIGKKHPPSKRSGGGSGGGWHWGGGSGRSGGGGWSSGGSSSGGGGGRSGGGGSSGSW